VREGRAEFVPVFLDEIPELFKKNFLPLDVALVQVYPPDSQVIVRWVYRWILPILTTGKRLKIPALRAV
jgi:hypothetical protein